MRESYLVILVGIALLGITHVAEAIPDCDQIECVPYQGCTVSLQFEPCEGGQRLFRCVWSGSPPACDPGASDWSVCNCAGGGGGGCFLAGTPIQMADGTTQAIDSIAKGDWVLAYDAATGQTMPSQVLSVHEPRSVDHYFLINGRIRATSSQPVLTRGTWVEIGALKRGDGLTRVGGDLTPVLSIERIDKMATVYNLEVSDGTYVASGFVVHNKKEHYLIFHPNYQP